MHTSEWQDKTSWNQFITEHSSPASFLQSWEWGEFQKSIGNDVLRVGMYTGEFHEQSEQDPFGIASMHKITTPLPSIHYWYVPRGPIMKRTGAEMELNAVRLIQRTIKKIGKRVPLFLRINPSWTKSEDTVLWDGLEFCRPRILRRKREPETTLITDITLIDEALLGNMRQKTRYNIRLAQRKGVKTERVSGKRGVDILWQLLQQTSLREKINLHTKQYYIDLCDAIKNIDYPDKTASRQRPNSLILIAKFENSILAAGLWIGFGDTLTYLYGGSSDTQRNLMAPYKLHWDAMRWGRNHGYAKYDWWGIDGKRSVFNLSGVSRFKQGFGGDKLEFADTYDFVFRERALKYLETLKKIREIF